MSQRITSWKNHEINFRFWQLTPCVTLLKSFKLLCKMFPISSCTKLGIGLEDFLGSFWPLCSRIEQSREGHSHLIKWRQIPRCPRAALPCEGWCVLVWAWLDFLSEKRQSLGERIWNPGPSASVGCIGRWLGHMVYLDAFSSVFWGPLCGSPLCNGAG